MRASSEVDMDNTELSAFTADIFIILMGYNSSKKQIPFQTSQKLNVNQCHIIFLILQTANPHLNTNPELAGLCTLRFFHSWWESIFLPETTPKLSSCFLFLTRVCSVCSNLLQVEYVRNTPNERISWL